MTKETIKSILRNISDSYQTDIDNTVTTFHINDTEYKGKCFSISITVGTIYCGTIYCDCVSIYDGDLIRFINDGKIISIFDYSAIEKIDIL